MCVIVEIGAGSDWYENSVWMFSHFFDVMYLQIHIFKPFWTNSWFVLEPNCNDMGVRKGLGEVCWPPEAPGGTKVTKTKVRGSLLALQNRPKIDPESINSVIDCFIDCFIDFLMDS